MSLPVDTTVTCQQCGTEQPFRAWQSLNVTLNPAEKKALLDGTLTRFTCPRCNWSGEIVYPLLYHDMEQFVLIWLWTGAGDPDLKELPWQQEMTNYRCRLVGARYELIEKVFIFDAGLDDRVIEVIKVVARAQSAKESGLREGVMLFARVEEVNSKKLLLFEHLSESESGNQIITLPFDTYERVAASIGSKPAPESKSGPWLRVGQDYALALVTGR